MDNQWHALEIENVFKILETDKNGLSGAEARRRQETYGPNKLAEQKSESVFVIFLRQFESPLIYILLAASLLVFVMGEALDGAVILAVLLLNAVIGSFQEGRAQDTLLALKNFVETRAVVIRDGREIMISDIEVVPGDVVILEEGEKIPADARIISSSNLKIDEAPLTGESESVYKSNLPLAKPGAQTIEQKNMVFKGTHISSGRGSAIVVASGKETVIGRIAEEIATVETEIPLKANIRNLSRVIIIVTGVASAAIFILGLMTGKTVMEMFATTISIAVSVIPEGLPVAMTLVLATGVWRMSKRKALVKRLQAVEALGQARVIAVDKTGTLTKNEMMVRTVFVDNKYYEIGGVGYEPKGDVYFESRAINPPDHLDLIWMARLAAYCAKARTIFSPESGSWRVSGDPTEAAMSVLAEKMGIKKEALEKENPFLSEIPFDYKLKYHAIAHHTEKGNVITASGAPETILALSNAIWHEGKRKLLSLKERGNLENTILEMSSQGMRVIAIAIKNHAPDKIDESNIESLTLVGLLGLKDSLRAEVKESSRRAQAAGIRVVMITGDHRATAEAIAREALIYKDGDKLLTGEEIEKMSDRELSKALKETSVFARVTPEHKLRIITAYKARGEIVAMTGDGVNDAPSLVAADLGVAMGNIGTAVAKEASDIVLLDDNFGSIVSAIEEGRSIYKTIKKVVLYLVSTSIGELLVIGGAISLGFPLPLLPAQIIWLNFVTDGFFTVALALDPKEKGLLESTFEKPKKYLIDALMTRRIILMSLVMMIGTLALFSSYFQTDLAKAWTVSLTILAVFQWFNAWNCRSDKQSVFGFHFFSNKYMIGATLAAAGFQILAVYHPLFQKFLRTVPLALSDWAIIIAMATSIIAAEEIRKTLSWKNKRSWSSSVPPLQANRI